MQLKKKIAEKISLEGRDSNYSNGWNNLWKKVKKINENIYLRKLRYHLYELKYYIANPTEEYQKIINNFCDFIFTLHIEEMHCRNNKNNYI